MKFFTEYYWNPECVTFNPPYDTYCDFLNEEVDRHCDVPCVFPPCFPSQACQTAIDLRDSICGVPIGPDTLAPPTEEGSGEEGSGASGN